MDGVQARFRLCEPETTLEANPDDVTAPLVRAWRDLGVNRVSLGVQSFDDEVLRYLGRRHDAATALRACDLVAGMFENWNIDLIFGAHPTDRWPSTLAQCVSLSPPHVAAYGLTYEPGTFFDQRVREAIDDEQWLELYQQAEEALHDYEHYEISNFALPGYASKHNLVYWRNGEYVGFGTGAYSFMNGVRSRNVADTLGYLASPGAKAESLLLAEREIRVETLIQHFRLKEGLHKKDYLKRFGRTVEQDFGTQLDDLKRRGLLAETEDRFFPTVQGFYLNNEIGLALVGA